MTSYKLWHIARMQIAFYMRTQSRVLSGLPEWYEIQRKFTHIIFWN